jgi:hypothetical protein
MSLDRCEAALSRDRHPLAVTAILGPPMVVALVLCGLEIYRVIRPDAALFAGQPPASFADAIWQGDVEGAYTFIRNGQDPNALIPVEHSGFSDGQPIRVSPLVLAVAAGQANSVAMLLGAGIRMDLPDNRLAICLARELGNDEVREALQLGAPAAPLACPENVLAAVRHPIETSVPSPASRIR